MDRMLRACAKLILMTAFLFPALADAGASEKRAKEAAKPATTASNVNYDDPNMVMSNDYAADTAITCPKTLKGRRLRECLLKNGLAVGEEISEGAEILSPVPSTSYH